MILIRFMKIYHNTKVGSEIKTSLLADLILILLLNHGLSKHDVSELLKKMDEDNSENKGTYA